MKIDEIKTPLAKDLEELGYHLYSLSYNKKDKILEVLIDESIDLNEVSILSEKVSKLMDKYDQDLDEYLLDVASAGCEREIRNKEEISNATGKYVHVETSDIKIDGTLVNYQDDVLTIEYVDKTRIKTINIKYADVKKLRHAVNFKENK